MASIATWRDVLEAALTERGLETLTELAIKAVERETPLLRQDPDLRALARSSSAANLVLVAEITRGNVALEGVEPPPQATAYARELARRNVPLTELARGYRIGQHVMWRFGVAEIRKSLGDARAASAIEGFTEATHATAEVLMGTVMERYAAERDRWVRSADAVRRATVQSLLDGDPIDAAVASTRLRYELRREQVAFIVWADAEGGPLEAAAARVGGTGSLLVPLRAGIMAGWCSPPALSADKAGEHVRVAIGTPGEDVDGFRRSHGEALEARRVARLSDRPGAVRYADVALVALLTRDLDQARTFAARELGGLVADDASTRRLADTVLAVLETQGSPRKAAQMLDVHENTVAKRVRAAQQILGHPIDERPAELLAALLVQRTLRAPAPRSA